MRVIQKKRKSEKRKRNRKLFKKDREREGGGERKTEKWIERKLNEKER